MGQRERSRQRVVIVKLILVKLSILKLNASAYIVKQLAIVVIVVV